MTRYHDRWRLLGAMGMVLVTLAGSACRSDSQSAPGPTVAGTAPPLSPGSSPDPAQSGAAPGPTPDRSLASPPVPPSGAPWLPRPRTPWQWQLSGAVDQSVDVPVYDIDLFTNDASVVAALHAKGRKVICYVSVGSWEPFRPDAGLFPSSVLGKPLEGFPDERWLDIRRRDVLMPIMAARFDLCRSKGFDAVEPDNVEGYANKSGFPLSATDQLDFNRAIAALAHARGLSVGLKNDLGQIEALVGDFDFSVNEQCAEFNECSSLTRFIRADKAVFHVEYNLALDQFCPTTVPLGFSSLKKKVGLDAAREAC